MFSTYVHYHAYGPERPNSTENARLPFVWQLLRDETNFCWERCPCHNHTKLHRTWAQKTTQPQIPGQPINTTTPHHTTAVISVLCTYPPIDRHSMALPGVVDDALCHQRHTGQGLTGRLDIGCGSPAALPCGAKCERLAAGEAEGPRRPPFPPASMIKGPLAPTPPRGGRASDSLPAASDSCAPVVSHQNHPPDNNSVYRRHSQAMWASRGTTGVCLGCLLPAHPGRLPV